MFDKHPTAKQFNAMSAHEPDFYCARCGRRHPSRKSASGYNIQLQCAGCKHGYTVGLIGPLLDSMADRHRRGHSSSLSR